MTSTNDTMLGDLLDEAKQIITGERQDAYGSPEDSFALIGKLWGGYLERKITVREVADMMILFKVARLKGQKPTRDTYRDISGYAAIAADRLLPREENMGGDIAASCAAHFNRTCRRINSDPKTDPMSVREI